MGPDERHTSTYLFFMRAWACAKYQTTLLGQSNCLQVEFQNGFRLENAFSFHQAPWKVWNCERSSFVEKPCWMWSGSECQKARTLTLASHVAWENVGIWSCIKDKLDQAGSKKGCALIIHHNLRWPGNADSCFTFGPATPLCLFWTLWSQKWSEQANPEVKTNAGSFGHWSCRFEGAFPEKKRNW